MKSVKSKQQKREQKPSIQEASQAEGRRVKRIAIYPGSFDPITLGHVDIICRIAKLYDEVIVLVAHSTEKKLLFSAKERINLIRDSLKEEKNVLVDTHQGLTIEYAQKKGAQVLVRGLRAIVDFEYEASMGNINKTINPDIETILVFSAPEYYFISSRMVKEVAEKGGPLDQLVPGPVVKALLEKRGRHDFAKS